jgi:hypothetical protein
VSSSASGITCTFLDPICGYNNSHPDVVAQVVTKDDCVNRCKDDNCAFGFLSVNIHATDCFLYNTYDPTLRDNSCDGTTADDNFVCTG